MKIKCYSRHTVRGVFPNVYLVGGIADVIGVGLFGYEGHSAFPVDRAPLESVEAASVE